MNVYSPYSNNEKFLLWDDIVQIKSNESCALWCVLGDFNAVRYACERKGRGNRNSNRMEMKKFNYFIEICDLFDILTVGRRYTWYRSHGTSRSKLDGVFMSKLGLHSGQGLSNIF